ncbi:MAG: PIN domain-containing protein [Synergistaceae bacterium]|nr:PIN domain-containing protein [Synergistaceae bacterium]MDD4613294.1 PIN domain-containing protein [Synergistaceae bacterium]
MKKYIYIDFENLPGVEMEHIDDAKILIFLGENQKKIPTEMIRKTQPMGDRVEWVTISGVGRNALDFHIAYYLAKNHTDPSANHYIVSMDAGYDPLIKHVALFGQKVKRIITLEDIKEKPALSKELAPKYAKALEILKKQDKMRRPKSRKTLSSSIDTLFQGLVPKEDIELIVEHLFRERFIEEKNKRIAYLD